MLFRTRNRITEPLGLFDEAGWGSAPTMSIRAALAASRQGFAFDALGEIGGLLCVVSIESVLCCVSHLLSRGTALFNECQVFISLEHRDSVREFTTVLRQRSNTRVPGELHFGTFLLNEHVGQRN